MGQVALNIGSDGATPQETTDLRSTVDAKISAILPDYTSTLPKSLIENILTTGTYMMSQCDQSYIELINSISATNSNNVILNQIAQQAGIKAISAPTRTSVYVVFTSTVGLIIPQGFLVSDGTYQYEVQNGGVVGSGGETLPLYCLATQDGAWAIAAGAVNETITAPPTGFTIIVTNPSTGTPAGAVETEAEFRWRVIRSMTVGGQGMATRLKQMLYQIDGVQQRLVSVRQQAGGLWSVICGGGDPLQVANGIFSALFDISNLTGSATLSRNITQSIYDFPDTYALTWINPPAQTVAITVTWNSSSQWLVSDSAVSLLAAPALIAYINSIGVGQPINDLVMSNVFKDSIKGIIDPDLITRLVFQVSINGIGVAVDAGTHIYSSDPESYFYADFGSMSIIKG
jgi:hypothetical protein